MSDSDSIDARSSKVPALLVYFVLWLVILLPPLFKRVAPTRKASAHMRRDRSIIQPKKKIGFLAVRCQLRDSGSNCLPSLVALLNLLS